MSVTVSCQLGRNDVSTSLKTYCKWTDTFRTNVTETACKNVHRIQVDDNRDKRFGFAELTTDISSNRRCKCQELVPPHTNEDCSLEVSTVIPRLMKIIRSGITIVSRNVISRRFL